MKVLLLIGSARVAGKSNSDSLGTYLAERLRERGCEIEKLRIVSSLRSDPTGEALVAAVDRADLIALSAPLYVDSAPALVIRALEIIAARRPARSPALVAICNNGFPEAHHNDTAIALYRRFAAEMGWRWAGGIAMGMGEILGGKPVEQAGAGARHIRRALDMAAAALAEGRDVPQEAIKLAARRPIPHWLYTFVANRGWRRQARKYGVADRLLDRPYL
jgi:hypothetical protein